MKQRYTMEWVQERYQQEEDLQFLLFWGHTNRTGQQVGKFCFSQWYELPFTVDAVTYATAEHWMMAQKALLFEDYPTYQKIVEAKKPGVVKALGREITGFDEQVWNIYKYTIVKEGNIHKFNQHPEFAAYLMATNGHILVEASPTDRIWGIGLAQDNEAASNPYLWEGENLLGFALMEARDFLMEIGYFEYDEPKIALPWKLKPQSDPSDLYWRMGADEDVVISFANYYERLTERERMMFRLVNPAPYAWRSFYDE